MQWDYLQTRANSITGDLLNILIDFLSNRKQRVKLNRQISAWASVSAGVPQGSILGFSCLYQ